MNYHFLTTFLVVQASMLVIVDAFCTNPIHIVNSQGTCSYPSTVSELSMARSTSTGNNIFSRINVFNKKSKTTPTTEQNKARIAVRQRPLVSFDETGKYIPTEPSVISSPEQVTSKQNTVDKDFINQVSGWDAFKDGIYSVIDRIGNINKIKSTNAIKERNISMAYSDTVESKSLPLKSIASNPLSRKGPGQKIMEQYKASLKTVGPQDLSDGENLFQTDLGKSFDTVKDSVYGTIDVLANPNKKVPSSIPDTHEQFKVASKPSTNRDEITSTLSIYARDVNSKNPLTRFKANLVIANKERKHRRSLARANRRRILDNWKRIVFDFLDAVQSIFKTVLDTPARVEETVLTTQYALEETMTQIKSTPDTLQKMVDDTKKSVEETQKATMQVVAEVQSIPGKVQKIPGQVETSIKQVENSIQQTKQGVEQFVQQVEEMTNEVKYFTGIEERPPPPPPPPRTREELAKDVAISVAKGTATVAAKAGVVVATGTAGMAVSGAKLAWQAAKSSEDKKKELEALRKAMITDVSVKEEDIDDTPKTIAEIDPSLEAEVVEALRIAEEALATQNAVVKKKKSRRKGVSSKDININEAVQRAKMAAAQAQKDVAELEAMLAERQVVKK